MSDCYELGNAYAFGNDVKQDYKKAVELFNKACDGRLPMLVGVCKWLKCRNRRKKVVITAKRCVIWADFIVF